MKRSIQYILGIGLSGRISSLKKKYNSNKRIFDYTRVYIDISEYKGKYNYSASCICNDTSMQGLGSSPYITIFNRRGFKSLIETESSLEKQIRFASKKFKETQFFLEKPIDHYQDGKLIENVWAKYEYNGKKWIMVFYIPQNKICGSCGHEIKDTNKTICDCGEFVL